MLEKIDDFLKFLLFFFCTRNVAETHFDVTHLVGFGFAEVHRLTLRARALADNDIEHAEQQRVKHDWHDYA